MIALERPDPELDDERRRYYRLTDFGQKLAVAEYRRLRQLVGIAQRKRLLDGGKLATPVPSIPAPSGAGFGNTSGS
jgi:hypothetical protein